VIAVEAQLEELLWRGARVEIAELVQSVASPRCRANAERPLEQLAAAMHAASDQLLGLIHCAPSLILAQVVRHPIAGAPHSRPC